MAFLDEIATYLSSVTGLTAVTMKKGSLPASPDVAMSVNEYAAGAADHGFGTPGIKYDHPGLQVVCRGVANDYVGPRAMLDLACDALAKVQAMTLSGTLYTMVTPAGIPAPLMRDENQRVVFVCNFTVERQRA